MQELEFTQNWSARPYTILVDSEQLESGEGMSPDFKKIAAVEIEEFKAEYHDRYPGSDPDKISDEESSKLPIRGTLKIQ